MQPTRLSPIKIGIAVIPALLILSIIIALYLGATEEEPESRPIEGEVTQAEVLDYLTKMKRQIGPRRVGDAEGQLGLKQAAAMIQGTLGPENLGYEVTIVDQISANGLLWKTIAVRAGKREAAEKLCLAMPYGERDGDAASFGLGFAEYLTVHGVEVDLTLLFYPPLVEGDLDDWISERIEGFEEQMIIRLQGGGEPFSWAEIIPGERSNLVTLEQLTTRKGWAGNVILSPETGAVLTLKIGEQGQQILGGHASRLIQLMPFVRQLLSEGKALMREQ